MILSQNHIAINVMERDRSVRFYEEVLGFTLVSELVREEKGDSILFMQGHGTTLELFVDARYALRSETPEAYGFKHLCFTVTDIDAEWERLDALGYCPQPMKTFPLDGKRLFFVNDPDGTPIEFHE